MWDLVVLSPGERQHGLPSWISGLWKETSHQNVEAGKLENVVFVLCGILGGFLGETVMMEPTQICVLDQTTSNLRFRFHVCIACFDMITSKTRACCCFPSGILFVKPRTVLIPSELRRRLACPDYFWGNTDQIWWLLGVALHQNGSNIGDKPCTFIRSIQVRNDNETQKCSFDGRK